MAAKKLYYKIGEACRAVDIQPYVLRYWETEFTVLTPDKSRSGQRVYTEEEISLIRRIKELLYDEGYTIAGAKKRLEAEAQDGGTARPSAEASAEPEVGEPEIEESEAEEEESDDSTSDESSEDEVASSEDDAEPEPDDDEAVAEEPLDEADSGDEEAPDTPESGPGEGPEDVGEEGDPSSQPDVVDTRASERIETLEEGIGRALKEVGDLLQVLDGTVSSE